MSKVFICSPFAATTEEQAKLNLLIARAIGRKALFDGHTPFAPHLLYPQMLDDTIPAERALGIRAGQIFMKHCDHMIQFSEVLSEGMKSDLSKRAGQVSLVSLKELEPYIEQIKQMELRHDRKS
jgi:hypothetical protein